jgi:thymidylate kinase
MSEHEPPFQFEQDETPEIQDERSLIVSLVGPTASGKSTLTGMAVDALAEEGVSTVVIKKDDAIRDMATERFGKGREWIGYTPLRGFGETEVNQEMNRRVLDQVGKAKVIFLEGGTRTHQAAETTLKDTDEVADHVIVQLDVSPREIRHRLAERRRSSRRIDDHLALAAFKLIGQYTRPLFGEGHRAVDPDTEVINANNGPEQVAADLLDVVKAHLEAKP